MSWIVIEKFEIQVMAHDRYLRIKKTFAKQEHNFDTVLYTLFQRFTCTPNYLLQIYF